jgi:hypothetical protein
MEAKLVTAGTVDLPSLGLNPIGFHRAKSTPGRIRTCNPQIRSLMRYPVAPRGQYHGSGGIRTHASKWRLELESSALDHSATKP